MNIIEAIRKSLRKSKAEKGSLLEDEKEQAVVVDRDLLERLTKQHDCPVWVSRDGNLHPLRFMNPRHMQNAYLMLCREYIESRDAYSMIYSPLGPDPDTMAFYYAEIEAETWYRNRGHLLENWINTFKVWMKERDIPIPEIK